MTIKPYSKNAKKHTDEQLRYLALSIREYGWRQPIVVDKSGEIIVGHGRWAAYQKYPDGLAEPRIEVADDLTPEQVKGYRLMDNKSNESEWNMDLVIADLKDLDAANYDLDLTGFDSLLLNGEFNFKNTELDLEKIAAQAGETKTKPCPNCGYEF